MKEQWNIHAEKFKAALEDRPNRTSTRIVFPRILELLGDISKKSVLDFGCGSGRFSRAMSDLGAKVTAYDGAEEQLRLSKQEDQARGIEYTNSLSTIPADSFDIALCFQVLVCNPLEDAKQVISSIHQKLKTNAHAVFVNTHTAVVGRSYHGGSTALPEIQAAGMPYHRNFQSSQGDFDIIDYWYSPEDLRNLYSASALEVLREEIIEEYFILHLVQKQ